jgi:hypothetical protein
MHNMALKSTYALSDEANFQPAIEISKPKNKEIGVNSKYATSFGSQCTKMMCGNNNIFA